MTFVLSLLIMATSLDLGNDRFPEQGPAANGTTMAQAASTDAPLMIATFLGGNSSDSIKAIATDGLGYAYVTGSISSGNFNFTSRFCANETLGGAFVAKISPDLRSLVFCVLLGPGEGKDIALDATGNIYVAGENRANDFPVTEDVLPSNSSHYYDIFVCKLSPEGSTLLFSDLLGGRDWDIIRGMALDAQGDVYLTGDTHSKDFPTTEGAFQTTWKGPYWSAFVCKVDMTDRRLAFSTFLTGNGDDTGQDIAVDDDGYMYVTGEAGSRDFPIQGSVPQADRAGGQFDAFISKLAPDGSALVFSTFLGGDDDDRGTGIALDGQGHIYVCGGTKSTDFPTTSRAYQQDHRGNWEGFLAKMEPSGASYSYVTLLGGSSWDWATALALDDEGSVYVTGDTCSADFPVTSSAYRVDSPDNRADFFLLKFDPTGEMLLFSTCFGSNESEEDARIALDPSGYVYLCGMAWPSDIASPGVLQHRFGGGQVDGLIVKSEPLPDPPKARSQTACITLLFIILLLAVLALGILRRSRMNNYHSVPAQHEDSGPSPPPS
jgi:hypothetical protein